MRVHRSGPRRPLRRLDGARSAAHRQCPSIRAASAAAACEGNGQIHRSACPSIRAASAAAALLSQIDRYRLQRVHRSGPRRPLRLSPIRRSGQRCGVSIDQSRVGRCGTSASSSSSPGWSVHRSEPRRPLRRPPRSLSAGTSTGVHRSGPRRPLRPEMDGGFSKRHACPSIRAASAAAAPGQPLQDRVGLCPSIRAASAAAARFWTGFALSWWCPSIRAASAAAAARTGGYR